MANALILVEPAPNQVFCPGDELVVTVQVAPQFLPKNGVLIAFRGDTREVTDVPCITRFTIPKDFVGPATITAFGMDSSNKVFAAEREILVRAQGKMTGIRFDRSELSVYLSLPNAKGKLVLRAIYPDGRVLPIDPARSVSYQIDNSAVANVDAKGFITGVSRGTTTLRAKCDTFTASAEVVVEE